MKLHCLIFLLLSMFATGWLDRAVIAAEEEDSVPDGPWISAVAWKNNQTILGTRSQGLLYRPAEVVQAMAKTPSELDVIGQAESSLWALLPLEDGRVVAADYKGGLHLFGGNEAKTFELDARWIRALSPSPKQGELLAGTEDGKLLVLSVNEAKETRRIDAHQAAIFDIAFSTQGDKLATAAGDGNVKLFSWPELEPLGSMSIGSDAVWSVAFVDNDKHLVSGGADRAIQLWDVAKAKPIVTMATASNWVTSIVPLPNTTAVIAGCMDGQILIVDTQSMQAIMSDSGPGSAIWSLALAPNGKRVAMGTRKHGLAVKNVGAWTKAARQAAKQPRVQPPSPKR